MNNSKYYIASYNNVYDIINNGIDKSAALYDEKEIKNAFNKQSENGTMAIFAVDDGNVSLVDPYDLAILNKLSHYMYLIHTSHNEYISDKTKDIADKLIQKGHEDLGKYLIIAANAMENKTASSNVEDLIKTKSSAEKKIFHKLYEESYKKAKEEKLNNPKQIAIMAALGALNELKA